MFSLIFLLFTFLVFGWKWFLLLVGICGAGGFLFGLFRDIYLDKKNKNRN